MKLEDLPYRAEYSAVVKPLVAKDKDKYLALASQVDLKDFVPQIDEKDVDLLPIAFNAFVVNRINKNNDVIDTETALAAHNNFKYKYINTEHDKASIVGVLLSSGFSEFGTDKPLTEEDVKGMTGPYNVVLGGVMWRLVDEDLTEKVEASSDPDSLTYGKISASWEIGFAEYELVKVKGVSKNIEDGVVIAKDSEEYEAAHAIYAEKGYDMDTFYYRKPVGIVVPLGIGLTGSPAAEVKGVTTPKTTEKADASDKTPEKGEASKADVDTKEHKDNKTQVAEGAKNNQEIEKNVSQINKTNVTKNTRKLIMNFKSIDDITNEALQEAVASDKAVASSIRDLVESTIKEASDSFAEDKQKTDKVLELAKTQAEETSKKIEESVKLVESLKTELETLKAEKADTERTETFNQRVATLEDKYELTDDMRKSIVSQVKDLESGEEAFASWQTEMSVFLQAYDKAVIAEAKKTAEEAKTSQDKSEDPDKAVASAVDNGEQTKEQIPNAAKASSADKWASALTKDSIICK